MAFDVYSTGWLLGAYGVIDRPTPFLYNVFFQTEQLFDTEEIYFDKVERARRLAPLVVPTIQGKAERLRGYATKSFRPAYVKPKHVIDPNRMFRRRPGEMLLGQMTPRERMDATILDTLQIQDDQITRREEYLAVQLLLSGAMVIQGEDYPPQTVDMQRPAGNTVVLTGALRWGQAGIDPLANLQSWAAIVQNVSGYVPTTVVMDPLAYDAFRKSSGVQLVMNSFRQQTGTIDLAGIAVGGVGNEAKLVAQIGQFDIWVYQQLYTDPDGTVIKFMPDNTVIMGSPEGCQGTRLYGAIRDVQAMVPIPRYPKTWVEQDPSAAFIMTQSAPLPVLGWPEATFAATVA